jgi:two-component system sensor histidine kinase MprB
VTTPAHGSGATRYVPETGVTLHSEPGASAYAEPGASAYPAPGTVPADAPSAQDAPELPRRGRRLRSLPLRTRLTLLTSGAVAVAVAVMAVACWFLVRDQLNRQFDNSLRNNARAAANQGLGCEDASASSGSSNTGQNRQPDRGANPFGTVQLVLASGDSCLSSGTSKVPVTDQDRAVAEGQVNEVLYDTRTANGTRVRVIASHVMVPQIGGPPASLALLVARPLSEVTDPLNTLALVLLAAAGVGVLGAGTAGLWIARTSLRPVNRLTAAAEHIARTEDLSVRLPVEGEDEIARLSASFNAMTGALSSSRDLQQQLIADAGHELRTPLTSLRTNIELLERSEATGRALPPEDRRELLASVKAQMGELAALIGDLQELSRPDAAPGAPTGSAAAFHEAVEAAVRRARLRGPGLKITAELAPWYVAAEPSELERAVVNLLDNAVKFSPPGGAVEVTLHAGELAVRDHGPGIPAEDLPHVFERFWRSPSARSLPGSGLGLSIVDRTARRAGGTARLEAAPGGGTLAVLRLPGTPGPPPDRGVHDAE